MINAEQMEISRLRAELAQVKRERDIRLRVVYTSSRAYSLIPKPNFTLFAVTI